MVRPAVGYEPGRVADLARRVAGAADHLHTVGSDDPAAAEPLARVAHVRCELELRWLPAIAAVTADRSMVAWASAAPDAGDPGPPGGSRALGGRPAEAVAALAAVASFNGAIARLRDGDRTALADLGALLDEHGDDPAVMAGLLAAWGPGGFFDNLAVVAGYGPAGAELAARLVAATEHAADPLAFGTALGVEAGIRLADPSAMPTDAFAYASAPAVTAFIAGRTPAPPGFALALAVTVTDHARRGGRFPGPHGAPSALPAGAGAGADAVAFLHDPVAAGLVLLAGDPAAAAAFYLDADRARYVFVEHPFHDGYTALFTSWAAAAAGPALRDPHGAPDPATAHAASVIATRGVAWLAERDGFAPADVSDAAAVAAAEVVITHLVAVERTVVDPTGVHLAGADAVDVDLPTVAHESFAGLAEVALLDADGLALLVGAAGAADAGVEVVRAGSAVFHENTAAGLAGELAAGAAAGADPASLTQRLTAVVARAGHLEGYLLATVWRARQAAGRSRDRLIAFWIDHAVAVAGVAVRPTPLSPLAVAIPVGGEELTGMLATAEAEAVAEAGRHADEQAGRLTFVFARALAAAGLVAMPGSAPGAVPTYDQFAALPAAARIEFWSALERGAAGHGLALAPTTARDAIKLEQADLYDAS